MPFEIFVLPGVLAGIIGFCIGLRSYKKIKVKD